MISRDDDKEESEMFGIRVYYTAKDRETLRDFYEEVVKAGIAESSRAEEGCLLYEYYFSADRENEMLLLEMWKDKQAQVVHSGLSHIARLGEIKASYGIETAAEEA